MTTFFLLPPGAAFLASAGLMSLLLLWKERLPLDRPNERSLHEHPIPRIGGLALFPAAAAVLCLAGPPWPGLWPALALCALSFWEDRNGLPVLVRLSAHLVCAAVALWPLSDLAGPFRLFLLAGAIVWATNLYNFMDGSNGLAGGMAVFGFSVCGWAAYGAGDRTLMTLCWTVAGAAAGFLPFNFHQAKAFLGDAGSVPLGFLAGAVGADGWLRGLWPVWFPVLAFAPFVLDSTVTLLRRLFRGERVWQAHREHYYQRLIRMGWSHRRTALGEYAAMVACGAAALALRNAPAGAQWIFLVLVAAGMTAAMVLIDKRWSDFLRREETGR